MKTTEEKRIAKMKKELPPLSAHDGVVYETCVGGRVFADCCSGNIMAGEHIQKARIIADVLNRWRNRK